MRHAISVLIICGVMAALAASCHRRGGSDPVMDHAEELVDCCPDSALALLEGMDTSMMADAALACYALLLTMAQDRNYITPGSDSVIGMARSFYPVGSEERMKADYYAARVNFRNGEYEKVLELLMDAEESALKVKSDYWLGLIYRELAYAFHEFGNNDAECYYSRKEYESFRNAGDSLLAKFGAMDHARALAMAKDEALYKRGLFLLDSIGSNSVSGDLLDLMLRAEVGRVKVGFMINGIIFHRRQENARDFYDTAVNACLDTVPPDFFREGKRAVVFESPFEPGLILSAITEPYAVEIHRRLNELNLDLYHREYAGLDSVFQYPDYYKYYEKAVEMGKSDQSRFWLEEQSRRKSEKAARETRLKWILTVSALFAVVAVGGVIGGIHSRRMRRRLIAEAAGLRNLLRVREENVGGMQQCIDSLYGEKFDMLEQMCDMFILPSKHASEQKRIYENVRSIVDGFKMNGNRHVEIEEHVNRYKDSLVAKFRSDFPGLPERDYVLFVYLAAGFSRQAIAFLMDDPIESVSNRKSRLKKRISSFCGQERDEYLKAIK